MIQVIQNVIIGCDCFGAESLPSIVEVYKWDPGLSLPADMFCEM